ncbi:efflux transporter outer membrane subunit [Geopsychrobacter electrodiphilus]|uniref:efflux transporter outer membrane subunit n=1 Tax=Geopsychrobacter electrodiphilus TaxID=225196 RepID=UPI00037D7E99|nr:efflux transporter outer membrane subunit [Geopsychrobacter electrodiphilus]
MLKMSSRSILIPLLLLFLGGCALGPNYQKPAALVPIHYKNDAPWKTATPSDQLEKGNWWEIYADDSLNGLEQQANAANQTLKAAYARLTQAQAAAGISKADRVPRLDLNASANRSRTPGAFSSTGSGVVGNQFRLPLTLGYEIDLFGRVKRSIEAAEADAASATADYQALLLLLQSDLARSYFSLRELDTEISLLQRTLKLRNESLKMIQSQFDHGLIGQLDLLRAQTELAATDAEAIGLQRQRDQLENGIALLVGQSPSNFTLTAAPLKLNIPAVTPGLPSSLLERRPDVAAAERQMAAASARIGVAKTAFFPAISLTGSAGFGSTQISNLFSLDNRSWGLGPAISLPIFDGGRNSANLERARAAYEEAIANYRQQVLVAFGEVEDGLNGLQSLAQQAQALQRSVDAATQAWQISEKRYNAGLVSYLEVIDAQRSALQSERLLNQNRGLQMTTSVLLVKALGGGW